MSETTAEKKTWRFPKSFWIANSVELLERAAYYGVFIEVTLYLSRVVGFNDIQAGWLAAFYAAGLYFLPPFTGALADRIGFRKGLLIAFTLLSIGYFSLGAFPYKTAVYPTFIILIIGGSFIKSVITGTVSISTNKATRARGFSIFYAIVNIGSFTGKTFAKPLRADLGLVYVNYFSAAMTFLALIVIFLFYKNIQKNNDGKTIIDVWRSFIKLISNVRLTILILIVTGFWMIQHQLYATMPKYVLRNVGEHASPEWYANVNPAIVILFVMLITQLMSKVKAITSMAIGMFIMPFSALAMSLSPLLSKMAGGGDLILFGSFKLHPIAVMMVIGIILQGLAECFISPRYLEYFSLQAPKGEEGLYLGFSHLHSFLAALLGFGLSGYLLSVYCPDPRLFMPFFQIQLTTGIHIPADLLAHAYDKGYVIWYYFAFIGLFAGIALIIFNIVTKKIDSKNASVNG
ncbi:MAG: MFS transporter [Acidobacteria bacterium]|nr:MFS transporter [Acidobacteriota bacterium]